MAKRSDDLDDLIANDARREAKRRLKRNEDEVDDDDLFDDDDERPRRKRRRRSREEDDFEDDGPGANPIAIGAATLLVIGLVVGGVVWYLASRTDPANPGRDDGPAFDPAVFQPPVERARPPGVWTPPPGISTTPAVAGEPIQLSNGRVDRFGLPKVEVDFERQGQLAPGKYVLVLESSGERVEFDVTVQFAGFGSERGHLSGRLFGPHGRVAGPHSLYVERRDFGPFGEGTRVSNLLEVQ